MTFPISPTELPTKLFSPSGNLTNMMQTGPRLAKIDAQLTQFDIKPSHRHTSNPIARMRPITDRFDCSTWSNVKGRNVGCLS
jgi:hypothetical protein